MAGCASRLDHAARGPKRRERSGSVSAAADWMRLRWIYHLQRGDGAMFKRFIGSTMALVLLFGLSQGAVAGNITFIDPPSGPGGTGTAVIDSQTPSAADVSLNFTSVAPIS